MAKGDLFCIKTIQGYGLFQEYVSCRPEYTNEAFFVVYYNQIKNLTSEEISSAMQGDYYYCRIGGLEPKRYRKEFSKEEMKKHPYKEFTPKDFGISENDYYFSGCRVTYLGNYPLPEDAEPPKLSRKLDLCYFTGTHKWYIYDETSRDLLKNAKGKFVVYKKITEEIALYPKTLKSWFSGLLEHFNNGYRLEDDDVWVEKHFEEFYMENPDMRPVNIKYDDVKKPYPTDNLRELNNETDYQIFCDKIEYHLKEFTDSIDSNKKAVSKPLSKLIAGLNAVEKETGLINTLESEELYEYIANILKSLKKPSLIETLDSNREW